MGNSKSTEEPKEETNVDTTNIGLWNMSASCGTTIGVGEILTIVVLVMVLLIIMKYCCKRMKAIATQGSERSRESSVWIPSFR